MTLLSKKAAAQLANPEPAIVKDIPRLEFDVRIRPLSATERIDYLESHNDIADDDIVGGLKAMARLLCLSIIDEDGNRIYGSDDDDEAGIEEVLALNMKSLRYIAEFAIKFNGFDLEDAEGNS